MQARTARSMTGRISASGSTVRRWNVIPLPQAKRVRAASLGCRANAGPVVTHAVLMFGTLVLTLAGFMLAIPFGETMMVRRSRRLRGITSPSGGDYGRAIADVFRGRMPPKVAFHSLFSPVVFFSCLGVCIGATIAT